MTKTPRFVIMVLPHETGRAYYALRKTFTAPAPARLIIRGKSMYAVIITGGKQYKVSEGDTLFIEKLDAEAGSEVTFDKVLLVADGEKITAGAPYVDGASVTAKLEKNGKGKKIRVFKYKAKKNERKKIGHRQPYSKVTVTAVKF